MILGSRLRRGLGGAAGLSSTFLGHDAFGTPNHSKTVVLPNPAIVVHIHHPANQNEMANTNATFGGVPATKTFIAQATDGGGNAYYLFHAELPAGTHNLVFSGVTSNKLGQSNGFFWAIEGYTNPGPYLTGGYVQPSVASRTHNVLINDAPTLLFASSQQNDQTDGSQTWNTTNPAFDEVYFAQGLTAIEAGMALVEAPGTFTFTSTGTGSSYNSAGWVAWR